MELTKIIVAGGRDFNNYQMAEDRIKLALERMSLTDSEIEIVSGHAKGADAMGEQYASEHNTAIKVFPADWKSLGRKAGIIRNHQMGDYADVLIAFWDGESHGTKDMIQYATKKGLKVIVFNYSSNGN